MDPARRFWCVRQGSRGWVRNRASIDDAARASCPESSEQLKRDRALAVGESPEEGTHGLSRFSSVPRQFRSTVGDRHEQGFQRLVEPIDPAAGAVSARSEPHDPLIYEAGCGLRTKELGKVGGRVGIVGFASAQSRKYGAISVTTGA